MQAVIFACSHGVDEISPVIRPVARLFLFRAGKRFFAPFAKRLPRITADLEPAVGPIEKISDLLAFAALVIRIATARFKFDELTVAIFEDRRLSVGRFLRGL